MDFCPCRQFLLKNIELSYNPRFSTTTVPFEAIQANGKYSLLQTIVYVGRNLLSWSDKHLKNNNHSSTSVPDLAPMYMWNSAGLTLKARQAEAKDLKF
jgi:hypothetical protein